MAIILLGWWTQAGSAQEHIKYGTAVKLSPVYDLPVLAAQEQGIFKKHGLDVEWVPARNGPVFIRDIAASAVQIGSSTGVTDIPVIDRGAPAVIVANLQACEGFAIWVATGGRFKTIQDLKGAKIGVSRLGGPSTPMPGWWQTNWGCKKTSSSSRAAALKRAWRCSRPGASTASFSPGIR